LRLKFKLFLFFFIAVICAPVFAQTHASVPLDNQVYYILEQAQLRGLCAPLSGVKPYTQSVIVTAIGEILDSENNERISFKEREILEQYLENFSLPDAGMDWSRGAFYGETLIGNTRISANLGATATFEGSTGLYSYTANNEYLLGTEIWIGIFLNGDIGKNVSYNVSAEGGFFQAPRKYLGEYWTYYDTFIDSNPHPIYGEEYENTKLKIYSEPLTHFPYTYRKRWDGSVHHLDNPTGAHIWPDSLSTGYNVLSEISASFLENKLILRMGRITHEWGSASFGSSLALNQTARPFLGFEADFNPFSWLGFSTMTGILEYLNKEGEKTSNFQNAYSITMIQLRYKNYFSLDFGEAVVWPKRFELGYLFPLTPAMIYQFNIGDFDNMAFFFSIKGQYPGIGNVWFSFFMDEMNFSSELFTLDRQMFAWQTGLNFYLPFLAFSSVKLSYTVVNPYSYTHNRNFNPWYGDNRMETAYMSNEVPLGYYLPPNSDELLARFETMPAKNFNTHLQYQMIRHGADFGDSYVDGSNMLSELDPDDRDTNPVLKRFFLQDGAYQWLHIIKIGGEWKPEKAPIAFYWEVGTVISYFTNIEGKNNDGQPYPYSIIDADPYLRSTSFIARIGIRIFPK